MNQTLSPDLDQLLSVSVHSVLKAGELVQKMWSEPRRISEKGFRDLVTDADHASQALIVEQIRAHFPDHGFLVEEEAPDIPAAGLVTWIIDPIDGTTNYSRQMPVYCISIAAVIRPSPENQLASPQPLVGVVYDPMQNELFQAAAGQGAFLNGEKIQVSNTDEFERAIFAIDWSHEPAQRQLTLDMIQQIAPRIQTLRAIGSAALALAWLAAGRIDCYFNLNLKPWDMAAGILLIQEAGGRMVSIENQPWQLEGGGFFAGNGRLSPEHIVKLTLAQ